MSGGMVIVGAGECGSRAALALREQGYGGMPGCSNGCAPRIGSSNLSRVPGWDNAASI
jgi:predicted NAD/FAD-dependent oxidoreductase